MSIESANAFLEKMNSDENFKNSFFACSDPEAKKNFIRKNGFEFTKKEIEEIWINNVTGGNCSSEYPCVTNFGICSSNGTQISESTNFLF